MAPDLDINKVKAQLVEAIEAFNAQAANGHELDQTIWAEYFDVKNNSELSYLGRERLKYIALRRPTPDPRVYVQKTCDQALDQKRKEAVENYLAERAQLEARAQELQQAQIDSEQKVKSLTEALEFETKRREAVERLAVDSFKRRRTLEFELSKTQAAEKALRLELEAGARAKRRGELKAELAENHQTQAKLQHELEAARRTQCPRERVVCRPTASPLQPRRL